MLEIIALFAPPLVALRFYSHLHRNKLSARHLIMSYGVFVLFINLCMYLTILYVLQQPKVSFDDKTFVSYALFATLLSLVIPFVVNMIENMVSVEVKRNVFKK